MANVVVGRAGVSPLSIENEARFAPQLRPSGQSHQLSKPTPGPLATSMAAGTEQRTAVKDRPSSAILRRGATSFAPVHDGIPVYVGNAPAPSAATPLPLSVEESKFSGQHRDEFAELSGLEARNATSLTERFSLKFRDFHSTLAPSIC